MIAVSLSIMQYLGMKVIGQRLGHGRLRNQKLPSSFIAFCLRGPNCSQQEVPILGFWVQLLETLLVAADT